VEGAAPVTPQDETGGAGKEEDGDVACPTRTLEQQEGCGRGGRGGGHPRSRTRCLLPHPEMQSGGWAGTWAGA
jgi:hypothetical protein